MFLTEIWFSCVYIFVYDGMILITESCKRCFSECVCAGVQSFVCSGKVLIGTEPPYGFDVAEEVQGPQVCALTRCVNRVGITASKTMNKHRAC